MRHSYVYIVLLLIWQGLKETTGSCNSEYLRRQRNSYKYYNHNVYAINTTCEYKMIYRPNLYNLRPEYNKHYDSSVTLTVSTTVSSSLIPKLQRTSFTGTDTITTLVVKNSQISEIEDRAFVDFTNLKILKLPMNNLTILKNNTFSTLAKLERLEITNNEINTVERFAIGNLIKLEVLDLSYNNISKIDRAFDYLTNLKEIDISHNSLIVLYSLFLQNLLVLNKINLSYNKIITVEQSAFTNLTAVEDINLSNNFIKIISDVAFIGLDNIQNMNINNNSVTELRPFTNLKLLTTLNLNNNALTELVKLDLQNSELVELNLQENRIRSIDVGSFANLRVLERLDLSKNFITSINTGTFSGLHYIKYLNISQNRIDTISGYPFHNTPVIQNLDISKNELKSFNANDLPNGTVLKLQGNPLNCDSLSSLLKNPQIKIVHGNFYSEVGIRGIPCKDDKKITSAEETIVKNQPERENNSDELLHIFTNFTNVLLSNNNESRLINNKLEELIKSKSSNEKIIEILNETLSIADKSKSAVISIANKLELLTKHNLYNQTNLALSNLNKNIENQSIKLQEFIDENKSRNQYLAEIIMLMKNATIQHKDIKENIQPNQLVKEKRYDFNIYITNDEGVTKTFTCARSLIGQYVFLQLVGVEGSLSLCEVEVFTTDEFSIDRCAPKSSPEDAQLAAFARTCYEFGVGRGGSFQEARAYCQNHSGDLVHGMSPGQTSFLYAELERRKPTLKTQLVWIGAQKEPGLTQRTWKWVNGDLVVRPAWGKDQPNNYNGEQNCVVLDGGRGWLWNDVGCNLDYLHWICQHKPSSCGSPDKQLNTTISGKNYNIGGSIQYHCPEGHMLVGAANRTCGKDGFWSGAAPTCKYIDCGGLPDLQHGIVSLEDKRTTYGANAIYSCHENYTLIGREKRTCGDHGVWSDNTPECLLDWCPNPPEINGGVVRVSGHRAGDTATYICQAGYILFGQGVISCGLGGEWSGKAPSCKYVDCGSPPNIDNGRYNLLNGSTTVDSAIEYSCNDDYWLDGQRIQKCTREGKWSADAPSCELIICDEPEVPSGSYVVGYDFNVHSSIEYHCEAGHILRGSPSRTCMKDGEWSGNTPTCEYIDCGKVPSMLYGNVDYTNGTTFLGSEITYSCTKNHALVGVSKRVCTESKQWSDVSPKCEEIRCPEPILAEHSILSVTGNDRMYGRTLIRTAESSNVGASSYKIGALVKYRCERGYKVIGEPLSTCEDSGQWSGAVPQCVYVDCGYPDKVENGKFSLTTNATYHGALALYSCDPNFELDGVSRRLCLENSTWSSDTPVCREIQCKDPDVLDGVSFKVSTHSVGGIAQYFCPRGHNMQGNNTRMCMKNGSWSGRAPTCVSVDCKHPGTIENGRVIVMNGTTYNSAIEYHCIPKYERIGPYLRKCMETGIWSGEEPRCEVSTGEPQDSSNLGTSIGIGAGVVLFLLLLLGLIYLKLRKATPVKNTENVEAAERKEDRSAAVMSYSTLSDRNGYGGSQFSSNIYENIHENENMYDAPYEETSRDSGTYEPEPVGRNGNVVTINGVAVR